MQTIEIKNGFVEVHMEDDDTYMLVIVQNGKRKKTCCFTEKELNHKLIELQ